MLKYKVRWKCSLETYFRESIIKGIVFKETALFLYVSIYGQLPGKLNNNLSLCAKKVVK